MIAFRRGVRLSLCCLVLSACSALFSAPAEAGPIGPPTQIDFRSKTTTGAQQSGGTFSYTVGSGDKASVTNAPENSLIGFFLGGSSEGPIAIENGTLDFTTGACVATCGETTHGGFASSVPQFAANSGFVEIKGAIPSLGITNPNTVLLYGGFATLHGDVGAGMSLTSNPSVMSGMTAMLDISTINPALLAYFGFNPSFTSGSGLLSDILLQLSFMSPTWNGQIASSDLLVDPALPEPPSLILFGSAVLLVAYLVRRKIVPNQAV